jgi:hypothetical protein
MARPAKLPLFHPDPVEHALILVEAGMDPEPVAEALVMRRADEEFMLRGVRSANCRFSSQIRAHIALSWCAMGLGYHNVAKDLHMSGAATAFLAMHLQPHDGRWRIAVRLRVYVLRLFTTGREYDARR